MTETEIKQEKEWKEESDANSLAESLAIQADNKRFKGAIEEAKRLIEDEKKREKETEERVKALELLVNKKSLANMYEMEE